jgi:uncharacterized RmlC-like cupin family protein
MTNSSRAIVFGMIVGSLVATLLTGAAGQAQSTHVMARLNDSQWGPAPPMLPAGAQIAVLAGNPTQSGAYVVRLKFPANYTIPAHSHPTHENVVVVSGDLLVGMGDAVDKSSATGLGLGGFGMLPANMNHFALTKQETIITLFGQGPVEFKYVNPADDPRHGPGAKGAK